MRNKSCGNGSKNCVAFRNAMRNGIAIGNPTIKSNIVKEGRGNEEELWRRGREAQVLT